LKIKKAKFKNFCELCNWFMTLPSIQQKKAYQRRISLSTHLLEFFGNKKLIQIDRDDQDYQEKYRMYY
jgi:hypothetical protein